MTILESKDLKSISQFFMKLSKIHNSLKKESLSLKPMTSFWIEPRRFSRFTIKELIFTTV